MQKENVLSNLLVKVSRYYLAQDITTAQQEIVQRIYSDLSASYCTVYIKEGDSYQSYLEYKPAETGEYSPNVTQSDLGDTPVYSDELEKIQRLVPQSLSQRILYLPFWQEKKMWGFLLVLWDKPSILDQQADIYLDLLHPLSLILTKVFAEPIFYRECQEKAGELEELYLNAYEDLDRYIRTTSLTLHDEIDRMLLGIMLQLEALQGLDDMDIITGRLAGLQYIAEQSLEKVQEVYSKTNPHLLSRVGLKAALQALVQEYRSLAKLDVEINFFGEVPKLSQTTETIIYGATRQILSNLEQQKYYKRITIQLTVKQGSIFLQIMIPDSERMQEILERDLTGLERQVSKASGKLSFYAQASWGSAINLLLPVG